MAKAQGAQECYQNLCIMTKRLFLLFAAAAALTLNILAQNYTLHSTSGGVKLERGDKTLEATKGMELKATDAFVIPEGGIVEVYNSFDKRIYKSLRPGRISVTKLLIEARQVAADNSKSVGSRLNLGKNGTGGKQAYTEKGMVTRQHEEFTGETASCDSIPPCTCPAECDSVPQCSTKTTD